jgi:HEAT repeat protein
VTNDGALAQRSRLAGANVITAQQFARNLLSGPGTRRRRPGAPVADERATPGALDPAFVDLYAVFVEAEQAVATGKAADPGGFDIAVDHLLSGDAPQAQRAAKWLGTSRREDAVEPLRTALAHEDAGVRSAAALALGALGARSALGDLVSLLQTDEHSMVREAAAQSLGRLGDRAVEHALETATRSDPKSKVRRAALAALAQIRARQ